MGADVQGLLIDPPSFKSGEDRTIKCETGRVLETFLGDRGSFCAIELAVRLLLFGLLEGIEDTVVGLVGLFGRGLGRRCIVGVVGDGVVLFVHIVLRLNEGRLPGSLSSLFAHDSGYKLDELCL